jgi:hypothetical protein
MFINTDIFSQICKWIDIATFFSLACASTETHALASIYATRLLFARVGYGPRNVTIPRATPLVLLSANFTCYCGSRGWGIREWCPCWRCCDRCGRWLPAHLLVYIIYPQYYRGHLTSTSDFCRFGCRMICRKCGACQRTPYFWDRRGRVNCAECNRAALVPGERNMLHDLLEDDRYGGLFDVQGEDVFTFPECAEHYNRQRIFVSFDPAVIRKYDPDNPLLSRMAIKN